MGKYWRQLKIIYINKNTLFPDNESLPPSYDELFATSNATAPLDPGCSTLQYGSGNQTGRNYSNTVTTQPVVVHHQLITPEGPGLIWFPSWIETKFNYLFFQLLSFNIGRLERNAWSLSAQVVSKYPPPESITNRIGWHICALQHFVALVVCAVLFIRNASFGNFLYLFDFWCHHKPNNELCYLVAFYVE